MVDGGPPTPVLEGVVDRYIDIFKFLKSHNGQHLAMVVSRTIQASDAVVHRPSVMVLSDIFRTPAFGTNHPLSIRRVETVYDLCHCLNWFDRDAVVTCDVAANREILRFHKADYLAALERAEALGVVQSSDRDTYNFGTMENPWFPGLLERAKTAVGGSIMAAKVALTGKTSFHPAGGTHHGMPTHASGFCYFNDPVFAVLTLLDAGLDRVAYVDLDAHHGDGVEAAFRNEPRVLTASTHEAERWPFTGTQDVPAANIINIPVPRQCNDSEFNYLLDHKIICAIEKFRPHAIVITCGTDALAGDPLSTMRLSNICLWDCVIRLQSHADCCVILGGGGYNPWTLARCWTGLWGKLRGRDPGIGLPPCARTILSGLACDLIDEDECDERWLSTLADQPNTGEIRQEFLDLAQRTG